MFRKKKKHVHIDEMNVEARLRGFFYDTQIDEAEELAVLLGATPISKEGEEYEREISDDRVERISYLIPLIHSYAHLVADAMINLEKKDSEEDGTQDMPDSFWEMFRVMIEKISMSVTVGVISQAADLSLIEVRKK